MLMVSTFSSDWRSNMAVAELTPTEVARQIFCPYVAKVYWRHYAHAGRDSRIQLQNGYWRVPDSAFA